jgi:hypothetical protein
VHVCNTITTSQTFGTICLPAISATTNWLSLRSSGLGDFTDFNIEQQASIIEDWWRITKGMRTLNNTGAIKTLYAYNRYVDQMRGSGLPHKPLLR